VDDGAVAAPAVRFSVSDGKVVDLLSRAFDADTARATFAVDGDGDLASRLLDVAAPLLGQPLPTPRSYG
jgi:hypothetical protein